MRQFQHHADSLRKKNIAVIEAVGPWADEKNIPGFQKIVRNMEHK